jgi:aminopeptidase N
MFSRILIFLAVFFLSVHSTDAQVNHLLDQVDIQCRELPSTYQAQLKSLQNVPSQTPSNMKVHWYLNPFVRYITGELEYTINYNSSYPANLVLSLAEELTIDSIYTESQGLDYLRDMREVIIHLPSFENNQLVKLNIQYSGIPPNNGFGSFVMDNSFDNNPILWTLSEPGFSSDWWPSPVNRNVKFDTLDVFSHTPPEFFAAGNGRLESIDSSGSSWIHHWKSSYPIAPYLIGTAVMKYHVVKDKVVLQGDTLPILDYIFNGSIQEWAEAAPRLRTMLHLYDSLFVHYPFIKEKYGHAQFNWGGGMEHQTMSFMAYPGEALTAHELAHQWFGNYITCGSWKEIWLNEGFATYLTGLYYERYRPSEFIDWRKGQVESITSEPGGAVIVDDTLSVYRIFDGRLTYSKAAMVLHMLRKWIGDESFFNGIRSYLNDDSLKYGYATTNQLRQHFEESCSCDLAKFFEEWIFNEGFPVIDINCFATDLIVHINVNQESSIGLLSAHQFNLPIKFVMADSDTLIELLIENPKQTYTIATSSSVKSIIIDPNYDAIAMYKSKSILLEIEDADVILYPNPTQTELRIKILNTESWPSEVQVFDLVGRFIGQFDVQEGGLIDPQLQSSIKNGVYIITFTLSGKKIQKRFVLAKTK